MPQGQPPRHWQQQQGSQPSQPLPPGGQAPSTPMQPSAPLPPKVNFETSVGQAPGMERWSAPGGSDPRLTGLSEEAAAWQKGLSSGSDQDATLALQRARDLQSGQSKELGDLMALQGGFGGARNQQLAMLRAEQGRELAGLNADLAADARGKQADAFRLRGGLEGQVAQERLGRGGLSLQGTQANNQSALQRWMAQQDATQSAHNANLNAWIATQQATAQQQQMALQAQQANNQAYAQAWQMNGGSAPPRPRPYGGMGGLL